MEGIARLVTDGAEQLLGRAGGPLHFRLFMMPTVVTIVAFRAGLRDARAGHPSFLWTTITKPGERRRLLRSASRDIGRIIVVAIVLDSTYQVLVLRSFYPIQLLIVVVGCTIVPYVVIRGPITLLARGLYRRQAGRRRD